MRKRSRVKISYLLSKRRISFLYEKCYIYTRVCDIHQTLILQHCFLLFSFYLFIFINEFWGSVGCFFLFRCEALEANSHSPTHIYQAADSPPGGAVEQFTPAAAIE